MTASTRQPAICTPGRLLFAITWTIVTFQLMLSSFTGLLLLSGSESGQINPCEQAALIRAIRNRLACHEAELQGCIFPEGRLFSRSYYAFSLVNIGLAPNTTKDFRDFAREEVKRLIGEVKPLLYERPFCWCQNLRPKGGIIWTGNTNLMRAGYVLLGGNDPEIIREFHETSASLYADFLASPSGCLESYPEEFWPCDNCHALTSLRLHDDLYATKYSIACDRWVASMRSCLDPQDGLIPTLLDKHAEILQRPRGCAMSWMLAFMPQFAPTFAKEQYARYSRTWSISALGMQFFREWPTGSWDVIDSDSGLVVGDAGMAATGVGIAATRANRDFYSCQRQQRAVEYLGLPTWSLAGEKTYFLRRLLVADVLALWGKTITSWRPKVSETSNSLKRIDHQTTNDSWMNLVSFAGIAVLILAFSIWMLRKRLREFRARKPIWSKLTVCCFSLQLAASLLYIFFSDFILLAAMAILTVIEACFLHLLPFLSWFGLNR